MTLSVVPPQAHHFDMVDVGRKRPTRRQAVACGTLYMNARAFDAVVNKTLPKGDALALAEIAGIMAAKKTPDMIPMCHTLPLDRVSIHCRPDPKQGSVTVYAHVSALAKTGVEMEALAAASAALLTIWDLTKGTDPALRMDGIKLLVKTGGKSGHWINPDGIPDWLAAQLPDGRTLSARRVGVIVASDRAAQGVYEDESGALLLELVRGAGAESGGVLYRLVPDGAADIGGAITACIGAGADLILISGGTGPGPRDITPEVLEGICDRMLHGLGDMLRAESLHFTDTAWLSRMTAGIAGATLIVALPGSPRAVQQCWDVIAPFIGTALNKLSDQGCIKEAS